MRCPSATSSCEQAVTGSLGRWKSLTNRTRLLAILSIGIGITGFLAASYAFHLFESPVDCWLRPEAPSGTAVFTVVMADEGFNIGFNGSLRHSGPWPVMNVTLGQNVIIHVINNDSAEAHGFQITHYFDQGIGESGLAPGKCYDVRFVANQAGSFQAFCNIFCTIHRAMQNGRLNIS